MVFRLLLASSVCFVLGAIVRFDTEDYRKFLAMVKDAFTLAGITFKERCFALGLDKSHVSRIESGALPLHGYHLAQLGAAFPAFYQALAVVLVREHGLSPEAQAGAALAGVTRRAS